jgi:SAM-dependent methyltransferase
MRALADHRDRDFAEITEIAGIPVTSEGAAMIYARYRYAASLARDRRVLEIACGSGVGLGLLGRSSRLLVGGDIDLRLLAAAHRHYRDRVPLTRINAEQLPFGPRSFDLVLFFEALYYVPRPALALDEVARVLSPDGVAVFVNANPQRPDFISSPKSVHYHTATEFSAELAARGFEVTVEGAFPVERSGAGAFGSRAARRLLETAGLVPRTLRGRARMKRLLGRKLIQLPPELPDDFAPAVERRELRTEDVSGFKVLYITARKRPSPSTDAYARA